MTVKLGINIDHIATIREARKIREPDPIAAAYIAELAGANGITAHLREDKRHIHFLIPAVMLVYPKPFYHGFPQHQDVFFRRLGPMGTGGDNNIDIAVGDALIVQFFHNHRQELVRIAQAGLVADDDRHFFPRLHNLCQGFAVNGIAYCF